MTGYDVVIGLEVHAQLRTLSKIFCPSPSRSFTTTPSPPSRSTRTTVFRDEVGSGTTAATRALGSTSRRTILSKVSTSQGEHVV